MRYSAVVDREAEMTTELKIIRPDDGHCHLRGDDRLAKVIRFTAGPFARALVMPNIGKEGLVRPEQVVAYREQVHEAAREASCLSFEPVMTFKVTQETTPELIEAMWAVGVMAGKCYPDAPELTTNSSGGVSDFQKLKPVWEKMAELGMVCCIHGEDARPETFCLDREKVFLETLEWLVNNIPGLKIVLEHVTTKEAVDMVSQMPSNVAASITAHHLVLTLDDVVGGMLSPHNFCKPLAKRPDDRQSLIAAARSGNPKFYLGSDTAPHDKKTKHCAKGCAGVFSAPVLLQFLAGFFEAGGCLERMEPFVSHFFADFFGLKRNRGFITLVKEPWEVITEFNGIVPFMAGQVLDWRIKDQSW